MDEEEIIKFDDEKCEIFVEAGGPSNLLNAGRHKRCEWSQMNSWENHEDLAGSLSGHLKLSCLLTYVPFIYIGSFFHTSRILVLSWSVNRTFVPKN